MGGEKSNEDLYESLLDLMGVINSPQSDERLLCRAGVSIDRALLPLLERIHLRGPLGVVALAEQVGRDQTTITRQLQKLEQLGFITRQSATKDQRIRAAVVTEVGQQLVAKISQARTQLTDEALSHWSRRDRTALALLLRKLADSVASVEPGKIGAQNGGMPSTRSVHESH